MCPHYGETGTSKIYDTPNLLKSTTGVFFYFICSKDSMVPSHHISCTDSFTIIFIKAQNSVPSFRFSRTSLFETLTFDAKSSLIAFNCAGLARNDSIVSEIRSFKLLNPSIFKTGNVASVNLLFLPYVILKNPVVVSFRSSADKRGSLFEPVLIAGLYYNHYGF